MSENDSDPEECVPVERLLRIHNFITSRKERLKEVAERTGTGSPGYFIDDNEKEYHNELLVKYGSKQLGSVIKDDVKLSESHEMISNSENSISNERNSKNQTPRRNSKILLRQFIQ